MFLVLFIYWLIDSMLFGEQCCCFFFNIPFPVLKKKKIKLFILYKGIANQQGASLVAQRVKRLPAMWETGFDPRVGKIP